MRAARRAHSITATTRKSAPDVLSTLWAMLVALLALLLVWRPSVIHAQQPAKAPPPAAAHSPAAQPPAVQPAKPAVQPPKPAASAPNFATSRTHVVKPGETLWGLAARYYGDGHAWPQLAKRNNIPVDGNKPPLEVGMSLSVPVSRTVSGSKEAAVAAAPADSSVPKVALARAGEGTLAKPGGSLAAQTAGKGNAAPSAGGKVAARSPDRSAARPAPARSGGTPAAVRPSGAAPSAPAAAGTNEAGSVPDTDRIDLQRRKQTVMTRDGAVRIGLVTAVEQGAARKPNETITVFHRDLPDATEAERRTQAALRPNVAAPRWGELEAAPFVVTTAELESAGTIEGRVGAAADELGAYPQRAIRTDRVEVQSPARAPYTVGQLLQAVMVSGERGKGPSAKGRVVVPSGVLEVVSVAAGGKAVAVVRQQSARIEQGQRLVPVTGEPAPRVTVAPVATPDLPTRITWLDPSASQPTLQSFVVLGIGSGQGARAGDEFALYQTPKGAPEIVAATARVVRVGADHATAVIIRQSAPDIAVGMTARRVGRAP